MAPTRAKHKTMLKPSVSSAKRASAVLLSGIKASYKVKIRGYSSTSAYFMCLIRQEKGVMKRQAVSCQLNKNRSGTSYAIRCKLKINRKVIRLTLVSPTRRDLTSHLAALSISAKAAAARGYVFALTINIIFRFSQLNFSVGSVLLVTKKRGKKGL